MKNSLFFERLAAVLAVLAVVFALIGLAGCAPRVAQAAPAPTFPTATIHPTTTATTAPGACTVTGTAGDWLYIRQTPGGQIAGALHPGQTVTVLADAGEWWHVQAGEVAGFVFKQFCK